MTVRSGETMTHVSTWRAASAGRRSCDGARPFSMAIHGSSARLWSPSQFTHTHTSSLCRTCVTQPSHVALALVNCLRGESAFSFGTSHFLVQPSQILLSWPLSSFQRPHSRPTLPKTPTLRGGLPLPLNPTMARNRSLSPSDHFPLNHSATSPQPQVSKRDKRRNMLAEKLSEMMASFSDNRDSHYRAQLAALQADINLILKADPYAGHPLNDSGEEASELITQIMGSNVPTAHSAGTDYIAQCGKHYARFVDAANDAMEERDYNLTMLWVRIHQPLFRSKIDI
jgi:hypothetical protein